MFEAFRIGITLRLNDHVTPALGLLGEHLMRVDALALTLGRNLDKLKFETGGLKSVTTAAKAAEKALDGSVLSASRLEKNLAAVHAMNLPGIGYPGAAALGAAGRVAGVGPHLHGGAVHLGPNGLGMGAIGMSMGRGLWPLAAAGAAVWGTHALYESAKDLDTEKQRFKLFNLGEQLNNEAFKFVRGMQVFGSYQTENMRFFREAQGTFRESGHNDSSALEGAKLAAPTLAKIHALTESLDEESKARMRTSSLAMLRWVDMSGGLQNATEFNRLADFGWKLTQSSGGNVNWEQLRQFASKAGVAGQFQSAQALAGAEPLLGEMKGGAMGDGLYTAFKRLSGVIKLPNQVAHLLADTGIWDKTKIEWNKNGGIKQFKENPFSTAGEFNTNFIDWYEKRLLPIYQRMNLSAEERARYNAVILGGTGGKLFSLVDRQFPVLQKSMEAVAKFKGLVESIDVARESLSGREVEFNAAWKEFKTDFGTVSLPMFSEVLKAGSGLLRNIHGFMDWYNSSNLFTPDRQKDNQPHEGQHWQPNQSGRGGDWVSNTRALGRGLGFQSWVPDGNGGGSWGPAGVIDGVPTLSQRPVVINPVATPHQLQRSKSEVYGAAPGRNQSAAPGEPTGAHGHTTSTHTVRLVLTNQGGRELAQMISKEQGKALLAPNYGGRFDTGIAPVTMNMKLD